MTTRGRGSWLLILALRLFREARQRAGVSAPLSILNLRKVRDRARRAANFVEQLQTIFAHLRIVVVDLDLVEERIDRRAQLCHRGHRGGKIFLGNGGAASRFTSSMALASVFSSSATNSFASGAPSKLRLSFFSSMERMFDARLVPASRFLPSSVSRNLPSASTRRTTIRRSSCVDPCGTSLSSPSPLRGRVGPKVRGGGN